MPADQEGVTGRQRCGKPFLNLAQGFPAPRPLQAHFQSVGVLNGADVHPDALRRPGIAQLPHPVGPVLQTLPLVVGAQGVSPCGAKIEAGVKIRTLQIRVRPCGGHLPVKRVGIKWPGSSRDQNMLAQNVKRSGAARIPVQIAGPDGFQRGDAFNHFKTVCRHQQGLGRRVVAVVGAPDPLDQPFDVFGCADLDHQIDITPVDPQIQRTGTDDCPQLTTHHRSFDAFALLPVERSVMNANGQGFVIGEPEIVKEDLGLRARVVKDQRGGMLSYFVQHGTDRVFRTAASPGRGLVGGEHRDVWCRAGIGQKDFAGIGVPGEEPRDGFGILHCGRQTHTSQARAQRLQAGQRQHQLIATFAFGQSVNFVDHNAL